MLSIGQEHIASTTSKKLPLWECKPHVFVGILTKSSLGRAAALAKTTSVADLLEELKQFFWTIWQNSFNGSLKA
jgi:hypothetical protein